MAYNGGEMKIDYQVAASGKANNVGFLIFINGQPQPYKFNSTETPYEYMHILRCRMMMKTILHLLLYSPQSREKRGSAFNQYHQCI